MSTYINNNVTAFQATNNLNANSANLSTDIERLSTGLRINSAADDPAGLVISENLAAQVSGVTQATANSNDAINEIKTAEGALNQVQALLISVRQLAVDASNLGVNDSTDVQADQTQIASAIESINQISATTQFGTKKLLDGSATAAGTTTAGSAVLSGATTGLTVASQGTYGPGGTVGTGTISGLTATAATATTLTSANPGGASQFGFFQGSLSINGNNYTIGAAGSNATLQQVNSAIADSGYVASIGSTGKLTLTSNTPGAPTAGQTADFSGLNYYASASATTGADSYASYSGAVTAGSAGGGTAGSATSTNTGTFAAADSVSGAFTVTFGGNTHTINVTATSGGAVSDINAALAKAGIGLTASAAAGKLVFTSAAGDATAYAIGGLTGLTDSTSGGAVFTGIGAYTPGGGGADTPTSIAATANAATTVNSGSTYGGALYINGTNVFAGAAYATKAAAGTLSAANVEAAIAASTGYTATLSASGAFALTNAGVVPGAAANQTFDTSSLTVNNQGTFSGYDGNSAQGVDASLSATYTPSGSATGTTITSTSAIANGAGETYSFANGLSLNLATAPTATTVLNGTITTTSGTTSYGQNLEYQLGADEGQTSAISIQSTAADQLGLNTGSYTDTSGNTQTVTTSSIADLNVTNFKGAQDAIAVIDNAISQISTIRANLGAFQTNVLQSNVTSLGVDNTNLQASQSAVQDTDLAATVTAYTKDSILVQSATSALSYANQSPQYLLKLLQ